MMLQSVAHYFRVMILLVKWRFTLCVAIVAWECSWPEDVTGDICGRRWSRRADQGTDREVGVAAKGSTASIVWPAWPITNINWSSRMQQRHVP